MAELTGCRNCAECGTEITVLTVASGDAGPLTVTVRGHVLEIPGLFTCTPCAGAVMVGEKETSVTWEAIVAYLDNELGPNTLGYILTQPNPALVAVATEILQEVIEVSGLLEMLIALRNEPGGLENIAECDGKCGHEHEPHPVEVAHLN